MRFVKSIFAALIMTSLLISLTSCGGSPVTFAQVPVPPEAAPLERGSNTLADSFAESFESSLAQRGAVELKLYSAPTSMSWETVDSFYTESLADSDWKVEDELRQETEVINTTGWTRGSFASEQGLLVGYAPDSLGEGAFLIVALFSE